MITRRIIITFVFAGLVLMAVPALHAEVSAELDELGAYRRTTILGNASVKNVKIWTVQRQKSTILPLNPDGDLRGDLWPIIVENPLDSNHPWVVWSAFNGNDFDLAWSRFLPGEWSPVKWVQTSYPSMDDLDPHIDLDLNDGGRPYITWWRDNGGTGEVYLSIFLNTRWMAAYLISDEGVDSRYPIIDFKDDGKIEITFETEYGIETRTVVFNSPHTITDDLNPLEVIFMSPEDPGNSSSENIGS